MSPPLSAEVVTTSRGRIETAVAGERGPVVMAVHGTPGDWRQARALAADLSDRYRVLLPARPGYGRTSLRIGRSPQEQADALRALLDALDLERAVAVGISGGGPSSYEFAVRHPERCAGLVLCCAVACHLMPPPASMRALAAIPGAWAGLTAVARPRMRRRLADPAWVLADLRRGLSEHEQRLLDEDPRMRADLLAFGADRVEALRGSGLRNDTREFARGTRRGPTPWPAGLRVPVHVIHGQADTVVPVAHAQHYAEAIPAATLEVVPGHGHALPITVRSRLAEIVAGLWTGKAAT